MSKLEELEGELYGEEGRRELEKRMRHRVVFPGLLRRPEARWRETRRIKPPFGSGWSRKVFKIFMAALAVFFLLLAAAFIFFYLGTRGQEAEILIHVSDRVEAGALVIIPVTYRNVSGARLEEVELSAVFPEGTLIEEEGIERPAPPRISLRLEDLGKKEESVQEFRVRFFGREGEEKRVEAALLYRPENLRARFAAKGSKTVIIGSVPLALSWEMPDIVSSGQEVEARIRYSASAARPFEDLSLRIDYPAGFDFMSANPEPALGDNLWEVGTLESGREGEIVIRGTLSGEGGESQTFRAGMGIFNRLTKEWKPYRETLGETRLALTPLSVQVFLAGTGTGVVIPGERLEFSLRYGNNTEFPLGNVTVRVAPEGEVLDPASIKIEEGGVFDAVSRAITWNPGGTPVLKELKAGQRGEFKFTIQTRTRPPMRGLNDINMRVRMTSGIEAAGIPKELAGTDLRSGDTVEFKVRSLVLFAGRALYRSSPLANSGPLPPKIGDKTTYTIFWEVRNFTNELRGVEVRASLPPNVKWENFVSPQEAAISFDPAPSEVKWRIGTLLPGTGVLTPALTAAFQVSVIPSEADAGQAMILIGGAGISGRDTFTEEDLEQGISPLTTELREDPAVSAVEWRVIH